MFTERRHRRRAVERGEAQLDAAGSETASARPRGNGASVFHVWGVLLPNQSRSAGPEIRVWDALPRVLGTEP